MPMCVNCSKLAYIFTKKSCLRCKSEVVVNIAVICEVCAGKENNCSVCLKKINNTPRLSKGCNCGKK